MTPREATLLGRALRKGAVRSGTHFTLMSPAEHRAATATTRSVPGPCSTGSPLAGRVVGAADAEPRGEAAAP